MKIITALLISALVLLCSCSFTRDDIETASPQTLPKPPVVSNDAVSQAEDSGEEAGETYISNLARQLAKELELDYSGGEAAIRKAYRYMIENIYFADPVGLDVWRYLSDGQNAVPYIENRSISPFLFKIGSCEDFAAATVMLLNAAGFEARYVAGYTLSVDVVYIDHAWVVVRLGGQWYHLDPQLEQNVLKNNKLTYRYYLKSDADMQADHKWGENLIAYWSDMPDSEKDNIRGNYHVPECGESFPKPGAESARKPAKPNMADIEFEIGRIKRQSGKKELPPLALNIEPPVLVKSRHVTPPLLEQQPELYERARSIIEEIPESASEFETALFIHDYLAKNVEYDKTAAGKNSGNAYGAIVELLANCDGYAKAFQFLCGQAGLESMYISGTSPRGVEHAWNAVRIDDLWYYADVTWDRPIRAGDGVYHDYFMLTYDEIIVEHIPGEGQNIALPQTADSGGYYERKGYFVKDAQDRTLALAKAFFAQLEDTAEFSVMPEPVFLEVKVLGGKQNYFEFKEHYIKNAFNILKEMQNLANAQNSGFKIIADASVRCDFNDTTQVLTFYPNIAILKKES